MQSKNKTLKICLVIFCLLRSSYALGLPGFDGANFFMKLIPLTLGQFAMVDDADYGVLVNWKWNCVPGRYTKYARAFINGKNTMMHRYILGVNDEKILVDHKDHNGLNNQRYNIRPCTPSQNVRNTKPRGTSKYMGVSKMSKGWRAVINVGPGKKCYLGYFMNEIDAARAYDKKLLEVDPDFGYFNFPGEIRGFG